MIKIINYNHSDHAPRLFNLFLEYLNKITTIEFLFFNDQLPDLDSYINKIILLAASFSSKSIDIEIKWKTL